MRGGRALLTDLYQLTMAQGYHTAGKSGRACFEMFFRSAPFGGGFAVFAGLEPLLDDLAALRFERDDLDYLDSTGLFSDGFLDYLRAFRFRGDVWAAPEGGIVFPSEPLLRAEGSLPEVQMIETLVLNTLNYQTLIATKAARIWLASHRGRVIEFGLRRAPGPDGALSAARAAFIGGAQATSNVLAARLLAIPARGTMAHSWVMSFPTEQEAFQAYARLYPDQCILLLDTYDTLVSGLPHAAAVGRDLLARGHSGFGVRLDSGNLHRLARRVRRALDHEGLSRAVILASNDLDEHEIARLVRGGAPIDGWGVGTRLVTGHPDGALNGVYKLTALEHDGVIIRVNKTSDSREKATLAGAKQVYRFTDRQGVPLADVLFPAAHRTIPTGAFQAFSQRGNRVHWVRPAATGSALLTPVMKEGVVCAPQRSLNDMRSGALAALSLFPPDVRRLKRPAPYPVLVSRGLRESDARAKMDRAIKGDAP